MSGDVQPRKRKDKKKKKDELGVEEPRGTAAALGEGDVFLHSQQDHGTGGHWCAKIIFFSLLAVLITLIGLIILENRGLTDLEANAVESRYSGVLEGWLEDAPDDDHHDEHTLDLKHHDDEGEEDHNVEESDHEHEDEDQESDEDEDHDEDEEEDHDEDEEEDHDQDEDSHEENIEADEDEEENIASNEVDSNEEEDTLNDDNQSEENLQDDDDNEEVEEKAYKAYNYNEDDDEDDHDQNDDDNQKYDDDDEQNENYSYQNDEDDDQSNENDNRNNEDEDQNDDQSVEDTDNGQYDDIDDDSNEVKNQDGDLSNEIIHDDDDNDSNELKANEEDNEDEDQEDDSQENNDEEIEKIEKEVVDEDEEDEEDQEASKENVSREADDEDDENFLQDQEDDDDEPPLERITAPPAGKPFVEIEEEFTEKPVNTLAEEEEYEKRQEQLRKEKEEAAQGSQIWLKLAVGGALLVATHAVLRRATAPRDIPEPEEHSREETPIIDRRMTLVPEPPSPTVQKESPVTQISREFDEAVFKKPAPVTKSVPIVKQDSEEEVIVTKAEEKAPVVYTKDEEKELYSDDEEEVEDEEEEEEEDVEEPIKETVHKKAVPVAEQKPTEDSEPEDVEIIDDEQIEEELEEEDEDEDDEDIPDVDDTELLSRLEAKYGRLPEPERYGRKPEPYGPERFGQKHKDGGNSIEDDWPGEPSDAYWRTELNTAEEELRQGAWSSCEKRVNVAPLASSGRARWLAARALDLSAEAKRDNRLLSRAIAAYLHLLKMNERLSDKKLLEVAQRTIDRIQFRGTYLNAEPIYRLLIRRFPENVNYRNNLTISFLMANRADLADEVLKETLRLWPNDRVALSHHGFVLKTHYNKLKEAVKVLYKALDGDAGPANEPRFYYHLGDALLLLGRFEEAHEVHKRGAALGHFLSPVQRSLYNVPRLKSRPWWPVEETPYVNLVKALERSWKDILKEGEAAKALYEKEKEGLKERGEWSQLDLFVRGAEIPGRCARAPVTCAIVRSEAAAAGCRRGQVKFSAMAAGTHVRPHVGPTNCRLRMHLALSNTKDTYIRVDKETRQWQIGKTFIFDDSFEHEVWHNGTGSRLVLIVDVWHPGLTAAERRTLPAI